MSEKIPMGTVFEQLNVAKQPVSWACCIVHKKLVILMAYMIFLLIAKNVLCFLLKQLK